jgi:hypothetical protein
MMTPSHPTNCASSTRCVRCAPPVPCAQRWCGHGPPHLGRAWDRPGPGRLVGLVASWELVLAGEPNTTAAQPARRCSEPDTKQLAVRHRRAFRTLSLRVSGSCRRAGAGSARRTMRPDVSTSNPQPLGCRVGTKAAATCTPNPPRWRAAKWRVLSVLDTAGGWCRTRRRRRHGRSRDDGPPAQGGGGQTSNGQTVPVHALVVAAFIVILLFGPAATAAGDGPGTTLARLCRHLLQKCLPQRLSLVKLLLRQEHRGLRLLRMRGAPLEFRLGGLARFLGLPEPLRKRPPLEQRLLKHVAARRKVRGHLLRAREVTPLLELANGSPQALKHLTVSCSSFVAYDGPLSPNRCLPTTAAPLRGLARVLRPLRAPRNVLVGPTPSFAVATTIAVGPIGAAA